MASPFVDIRRFPRVRVEAGYSIRFQVGGRRFFGLPVTNLGGGGCCFRISVLLATALEHGAILSRVCIEHPGIPLLPQQARIAWILGNHPRDGDPTVLVGIEYLDPSQAFLQAVDHCIAAQLKQGGPGDPREPRRS